MRRVQNDAVRCVHNQVCALVREQLIRQILPQLVRVNAQRHKSLLLLRNRHDSVERDEVFLLPQIAACACLCKERLPRMLLLIHRKGIHQRLVRNPLIRLHPVQRRHQIIAELRIRIHRVIQAAPLIPADA